MNAVFKAGIALSLFVSKTSALQFLLNTVEPVCLNVTPTAFDQGITVSYTVTGVNEDQVTFTATQNKQILDTVTGERDQTLKLDNKGKAPVELCWTKLDRKAKKVNFIVSQPTKDMNKKATLETVEDLTGQIEDLQAKLDQISMNIVSQRDVEREHFELTDATASNQGWMSFLKLIAVLGICGCQVYFTTSFFNQKGGMRRGGHARDINPFAQSVI